MKKSVIFLLLLLIPVALFGLGKKNNSEESKIYSMTEEEIVNGKSCTKGGVRRSSYNNKTSITVTRFDGVDYIATLTPKNQMVDLIVSCKVTKGELRVVLCDNEKILYEFEVTEKNQIYNIPVSSSKYYLKAVGENANYSIELEYKAKKVDLPTFEATIL